MEMKVNAITVYDAGICLSEIVLNVAWWKYITIQNS